MLVSGLLASVEPPPLTGVQQKWEVGSLLPELAWNGTSLGKTAQLSGFFPSQTPSQIPSELRNKSHHVCLLCFCTSLVPAMAQRGKMGNADAKQAPLPEEKSKNRVGSCDVLSVSLPAASLPVALPVHSWYSTCFAEVWKSSEVPPLHTQKHLNPAGVNYQISAVTALRTSLSQIYCLKKTFMPDTSYDT